VRPKMLNERDPLAMGLDRARDMAAELQSADPEWKYVVQDNPLGRPLGTYAVAVYEQDDTFVGYWTT